MATCNLSEAVQSMIFDGAAAVRAGAGVTRAARAVVVAANCAGRDRAGMHLRLVAEDRSAVYASSVKLDNVAYGDATTFLAACAEASSDHLRARGALTPALPGATGRGKNWRPTIAHVTIAPPRDGRCACLRKETVLQFSLVFDRFGALTSLIV